ncbi:MAG: biopolymer transporter ExbD [Acidobacteriota bacterium]|nr:biopolymer transporter ExbD [Acidobacteriota bacterium]MDH3530726.1 biopolymer transporter ExbD [Acidobacteriota bacterium]
MNRPDINVTPLIDVLLVLLIIFMVVSPLKPSQIESKLPQEPDVRKSVPNAWTLVVTIGQDEAVSLNNDRKYKSLQSLTGLTEDLKKVFEKRKKDAFADSRGQIEPEFAVWRTVFIKAPKSMSYGNVMTVIDAVKLAGAELVIPQIDGLEN